MKYALTICLFNRKERTEENKEHESILISCFSRSKSKSFKEKNGSSNLQLIINKIFNISNTIEKNINSLVRTKNSDITSNITWSNTNSELSPESIRLIQNM
jgi:hypothetical protein